MTDLELLDSILSESPIVIQRPFFKVTADLKSAIFLSQIYYWSKRMDHDWFYKTMEELQQETSLTVEEQRRVRKHLRALKLIEEKFKNTPPKLYFKFNFTRFIELAALKYSQPSGNPVVEEPRENKEPSGNPTVGKPEVKPSGNPRVLYKEHKTTTEDYIKEKDKKEKRLPARIFELTDTLIEWGASEPEQWTADEMRRHAEFFKDYLASNAKTYKDPVAAFRNCVRGNWTKLTRKSNGGHSLQSTGHVTKRDIILDRNRKALEASLSNDYDDEEYANVPRLN